MLQLPFSDGGATVLFDDKPGCLMLISFPNDFRSPKLSVEVDDSFSLANLSDVV